VLIVPFVAAAAVAATVTFGSGSDKAGTAAANGNTIVIRDFAYSPDSLSPARGVTITVTNSDDAAHTLTADDGAFDTGDLGDGGTETITVEEPGRYEYHCEIHDYMTGVLEVGE